MAAINFHILEGEDVRDIDVVVAAYALGDVEEGDCVFEKWQTMSLCLCGRGDCVFQKGNKLCVCVFDKGQTMCLTDWEVLQL